MCFVKNSPVKKIWSKEDWSSVKLGRKRAVVFSVTENGDNRVRWLGDRAQQREVQCGSWNSVFGVYYLTVNTSCL